MSLHDAYEGAVQIIGPEAECFETAQAVEKLRRAWRPERVRAVLLAESHVWTSATELQSRVKLPVRQRRSGVPDCFVRFVYCLGYGESDLLTCPVNGNRGTPQYWQLFHDALHGPDVRNPLTAEKNRDKRIALKQDMLGRLHDNGIWLVDASVTGLYRHKSPKLAKGSRFGDVLNTCWESHVRGVLQDASPQRIVIVGRGVEAAIGNRVRSDLSSTKVKTISQPQAHLTSAVRRSERVQLFEFCRGPLRLAARSAS